MAIETVAQNTQSSFADPQNGTSPIDADEVTANDNALRGKFNTHDADDTIHLQGSTLAARPAAGVAGRKWMTRDAGSLRIFRDTGSAWEEISYIPSASDATITGIITFSSAPVFSAPQTFADDVDVGGNLAVTGTLDAGLSTLSALSVSGDIGVGDDITVNGDATIGGVITATGAITGASFSGSGSGLTSIPSSQLSGALPAISGASLTGLNGSAIASGTVAEARLPTSYSAMTIATATIDQAQGHTAGSRAILNLEGSASYLFSIASGTSLTTASAPAGGTNHYINVRIGVTDYRIALIPV